MRSTAIIITTYEGKIKAVFKNEKGELEDIVEGSKVQVINLIAQILTDRLEEP